MSKKLQDTLVDLFLKLEIMEREKSDKSEKSIWEQWQKEDEEEFLKSQSIEKRKSSRSVENKNKKRN